MLTGTWEEIWVVPGRDSKDKRNLIDGASAAFLPPVIDFLWLEDVPAQRSNQTTPFLKHQHYYGKIKD